MTNSRRRAHLVAFALAVAAATTARAQSKAVVRVEGSAIVRICGDCEARRVSFDVTQLQPMAPPALAAIAAMPPRVFEVIREDARVTPAEAAAFTFAWRVEALPKVTQKRLILDLTVARTLRAHGTYTVTVSLLPIAQPAHPFHTLKVIVPVATLDLPPKLRVERTVFWPDILSRFGSTAYSPLSIRETGGLTNIEQVRTESAPFAEGARPVAGSLKVEDVAVGRDVRVTVPYAETAGFPVGTATGALVLRAPELQQPLTIAVEVVSRLSRWYLSLAIVAGFVASWVIKVWLATHIQLTQARALANKLLGSVTADQSRFPEVEFTEATGQGIAELKAARAQKDPAMIDNLRGRLDAQWRAAVQTAESRRTQLRSRERAFADLVTLDWHLPPDLVPALVAARTAAAAHSTTPLNRDIGSLTTALDAAQQALAQALLDGAAWQDASRKVFDDLLDRPLGLPDTLSSSLAAAVANWRERYQAIERLPQSLSGVTIEPLLRTIAGEYLAVQDAVAVMIRRLDATLADAEAALAATPSAGLTGVRQRVSDVKPMLRALVDRPSGSSPLDVLRDLQSAWERELTSFVADADNKAKILALAKERKFGEAAVTAAYAAKLPAGRKLLQSGGPSTTSLQSPAGPPLPDPFSTSLLPFNSNGQPIVIAPGPAGAYFEQFIATTKHLQRSKAAQTIVLAAFVLAWAFGKYTVSWDGTGSGLLSVFFGSFAIDVGIDTFLAKLKS